MSDPPPKPCGACNKKGADGSTQTPCSCIKTNTVNPQEQANNDQKNVENVFVSSGPCASKRFGNNRKTVESEEQDNNKQENVREDEIEQDYEQECFDEEVLEIVIEPYNNEQEIDDEEVIESQLNVEYLEQDNNELEPNRNISFKCISSLTPCVCERSEKTICAIKSSVEFIEDSNIDHKKPSVSFPEPRSSIELIDCEGRVIPQIKDKVVTILHEASSDKLKNECSENEICSCRQDDLYNTVDESGDSVSDPREKNRGKHYYYTNPERTLLGGIRKLFKVKKKKKTKLCRCVNLIEKIPDHACRVKVEAWEKHDKVKCSGANTDYKYVGQLLFPVCSKDIFYEAPGVIARKSMKSFHINDPNKFGQPVAENRQYAYPDTVIPRRLLEWSIDGADVSVVKNCPAKLEPRDSCTCSY